jgi:hypothetical protein
LRRKKIFWLAIGAVFLIGFIFLAYSQICETNAETKQDNCSRRHMVVVALWHASKFFDDHNGAFTALFTIVLSISTIGLWTATNKLYDAGERQLKLIEVNAAEQSRTTQESLKIAGQQTAILGAQTDIALKQKEIARQAFIVTHRPRLRVRHVSIKDESAHIGLPLFFFNQGDKIEGGLVVVNVGGSNAIVINTRYRIYFSKDGLPAAVPYDGDGFRTNLLFPEQVLTVGESCATPIADVIIMDNPALPPEAGLELRAFERGNWKIYVMGQIKYRDESGVERFMGFCREGGKDGRFRPVDDIDYEYED